jgi:hypothetical protein
LIEHFAREVGQGWQAAAIGIVAYVILLVVMAVYWRRSGNSTLLWLVVISPLAIFGYGFLGAAMEALSRSLPHFSILLSILISGLVSAYLFAWTVRLMIRQSRNLGFLSSLGHLFTLLIVALVWGLVHSILSPPVTESLPRWSMYVGVAIGWIAAPVIIRRAPPQR